GIADPGIGTEALNKLRAESAQVTMAIHSLNKLEQLMANKANLLDPTMRMEMKRLYAAATAPEVHKLTGTASAKHEEQRIMPMFGLNQGEEITDVMIRDGRAAVANVRDHMASGYRGKIRAFGVRDADVVPIRDPKDNQV